MKKIYRPALSSRIIALFCICTLLLPLFSPVAVSASTGTNTPLHSVKIKNLTVEYVENNQFLVRGNLSGIDFSITGQFYRVYDDIYNSKIYFVEEERNYSEPIFILNMEFEESASLCTLNLENRKLEGEDVVRIAAYSDGEFYYAEQRCNIPQMVSESVISISKKTESAALETIISNTAWYSHINNQKLTFSESSGQEKGATPILGDTLDATDTAVINSIGRSMFTSEQFVYGWRSTGGFVIHCLEWPSGTGNYLTYCLYYSYTMNPPVSGDNNATIQVELTADRQYIYNAVDNTIEAHFLGTDYRMYDVKLALACAQVNGQGYDFIYSRTTVLQKNDGTHPGFTIANALAKQLDPTGVYSIASDIFNAFTSSDAVSGITTVYWPNEYNLHYQSSSFGKTPNTMIRAVRIDTDGYLLNGERTYLSLTASVMDRDYLNSSANIAMAKAIKFAFSFNLRSKNEVWFWTGRGDDRGDITYEIYKTYTL